MSTISPIEVHPIGLTSAGITMSPEFDATVDFDDEYRYELVHGVLVVHAIPVLERPVPTTNLIFVTFINRRTAKSLARRDVARNAYSHRRQPPPRGSSDLGRIGTRS
jgi:hypothetical protein